MEAGEQGGGQAIQHARGKYHIEVGREVVPLDLANAGDGSAQGLALDNKTQLIAQANAQTLRQLGFDRHGIVRRAVVPPLAGGQLVVGRQCGRPGQAEVAVDGAGAAVLFAALAVSLCFLAYFLAHRLTIDADQAPRRNGVEGRAARTYLLQLLSKGLLLAGQDIQCKVVGRIGRQLILPVAK